MTMVAKAYHFHVPCGSIPNIEYGGVTRREIAMRYDDSSKRWAHRRHRTMQLPAVRLQAEEEVAAQAAAPRR